MQGEICWNHITPIVELVGTVAAFVLDLSWTHHRCSSGLEEGLLPHELFGLWSSRVSIEYDHEE